jgi:hypothetical protein
VKRRTWIRISSEAADWARRRAVEEKIAVSEVVDRMLAQQMRHANSCREAYKRFRTYRRSERAGAASRMPRKECHERR